MTKAEWRPGDGFEAGMEVVDGPTEVAADRVPSINDEVPVATYADWRVEDTKVVSCRISNDVFPGERFNSREEAVRVMTARYGRLYEVNYTPGRAYFRVKK